MLNCTPKISALGLGSLLLMALLLSGCAHSKESTDAEAAGYWEASGVAPGDSDIRADQIALSGARSVEEMLQGRAAGVSVMGTAEGGFRLRILGATSISGSTEPLIVIDGRELPRWYRGSIPVSPRDVESIRVLKSATDKAFYGIRGANGIISITTKRGS